MTPRVVILTSPSGGGKTTITRALLARRRDLGYSVSATTRPPRAGEVDGQAYHFLSSEEFARREAAGEFLEVAGYAGARYGTLRQEVERVLGQGRHVILDVEIEGARQLRRAYPPPRSLAIFVLPPGPEEWLERLRTRGTAAADALAQRIRRADAELGAVEEFDATVVNDDLERAVAEVERLIGGEAPRPPGADVRRLVARLRAAARAHAAA